MAGRVGSSARLRWMFGLMMVASAVVAVRLFTLQILGSDRLTALAADQRLRTIALPAERGSIFAADGTELAISMEMKTIFASPRFIKDPQRTASALAPVLGLDAGPLAARLSGKSGFVYLARRIDPALALKVKDLGIPGVGVMVEPKRFYPSGSLAGQVLGFVGGDYRGLAGLELRYDKLLRGDPGLKVMERDPSGRPIPSGRSSLQAPVKGQDLVLTIDRQIQFEAEAALARALAAWNARSGSVVVMDPRSGDILAMANGPGFDPNEMQTDNAGFRRNRAVTDVFEPGSSSKVITAAAALETGVTTSGEVMRVPDRLKIGAKIFKDAYDHPVESLSFAQVIQKSSNVGTIQVAQRLGKARLQDYLARFGYGRTTGLGFPGESAGIVPKPERWWATSLGTIAIGQGVAVTPLQLAQSYSAVANGGMLATPRLVQGYIDSSGRRHPAPLAAPRRVIEKATADQLKQILVGVTEEGTGTAAAIAGYRVAGKTGTAQKPRQGAPGYSGYTASFVGFAPAEDPRLVVSVVLDDPTPFLAGQTAAVTFKEVMQLSLRRLAVAPGSGSLVSGN